MGISTPVSVRDRKETELKYKQHFAQHNEICYFTGISVKDRIKLETKLPSDCQFSFGQVTYSFCFSYPLTIKRTSSYF